MDAAPPLPPPALVQPAPRQVSYGLVAGRAPAGTRTLLVSANGRPVAARLLRGRRFFFRVALPTGPLALRVTAVARDGRRSTRVVRHVYGLPAAARPGLVGARNDPVLAGDLRRLAARFDGTSGLYVQSLTSGFGAAWNARARFPAASTVKVAIAAAVLARRSGIPPPGSRLAALLERMIIPSDDEAANRLLSWLGGSTSAGGQQVTALMRSLGMRDSLMYGGYLTRAPAGPIPARVERQPSFVGKRTTAYDLALLHRAVWLRTAGLGPFRRAARGFTPADARHLLWLLARVRDTPKLDRFLAGRPDTVVLHKAGWISTSRHDTGLVFWRGGVIAVSVLTWRAAGARADADLLAGRVAARALARIRALEGRRG